MQKTDTLTFKLAKLMTAVAWADGKIDNSEINALKNLLFSLPELTAGEWAELERTGLPLGVSGTEVYRELCRDIGPGHILVIGTDGIWESHNAAGQMFGKRRLLDIVEQNRTMPAGGMLDTVIEAIEDFCGEQEKNDDVTLVIIKIT